MAFPPIIGAFEIDFGGMDMVRSRDCIVFVMGDTHMVVPDAAMLADGWAGGQGVKWVSSTTDEFTVSFSDGLFGGFLIWGSDESADKFTSMTTNQTVYDTAVMVAGNAMISTSTYEQFTYASRTGGPPLVPLVYAASDPLFFSLRGFWTKEDEMTLSAAPLAPAMSTGVVAQVPKPVNQYFLGVQVVM